MNVRSRWTFSLSSLMLVVTYLAVCLGIGAASPGMGVACGVLIPAVFRTGHLVRREIGQMGQTVSSSLLGLALFIFFESMVVLTSVTFACGLLSLLLAVTGFGLGATVCAPFVHNEDAQFQIGAWTGAALAAAVGIPTLLTCLRVNWSQRQF